MNKLPERIYLQLGGEWSDERVFDSDIEYLRKDANSLRHASAEDLIREVERRYGGRIETYVGYEYLKADDFLPDHILDEDDEEHDT